MSKVPKIKYETRLVAFLDVMGFQELLKTEQLKELQGYYDEIIPRLDTKRLNFKEKENYKKLIVSDSIIMTVVITKNNLETAAKFFSEVALVQFFLASKCNIWLRGAITVGDLFIDESENILVGPAFVSAWNLEKNADFPRVIIDPKVSKHFGLAPNKFVQSINSKSSKNSLLVRSEVVDVTKQPFISNAMQLDWFRFAIERTEDLSELFDGFETRHSTDQNLYQKCMLLGIYMRESWNLYKGKGPTPGDRNRFEKINQRLAALGY
jgi:hypothetical protein